MRYVIFLKCITTLFFKNKMRNLHLSFFTFTASNFFFNIFIILQTNAHNYYLFLFFFLFVVHKYSKTLFLPLSFYPKARTLKEVINL